MTTVRIEGAPLTAPAVAMLSAALMRRNGYTAAEILAALQGKG